MASGLVHEKVWLDKSKYDDAERQHFENLAKELPLSPTPAREENTPVATPAVAPLAASVATPAPTPVVAPALTPAPTARCEAQAPAKPKKEKMSKAEKKRANKKEKEVLKVPQVEEKQHVEERQQEKCQMDSVLANVPSIEVVNRINSLETALNELRTLVLGVQSEVKSLAKSIPSASRPTPAVCPMPTKAAAPKAAAPKDDSDDGVDLFASDSEGEDDAAAAKIREERLANYAAKKSQKPVLIAKSNIILDVKPWDDETDMKKMEELVRGITTDGLLWGASKLVVLAYGIQKLQISCVVEDDKVSIDWLQEEIEKNEDYVQSVDIAAFNKV